MESLLIIYLVIIALAACEIEALKTNYVSCGSVVKLLNSEYGVRLHSHDVKYGSGSGQQSVTGTEIQEDVNSHWRIKNITGTYCERGQPIRCGNVIRLEHLATEKNLHSHFFTSPLSGNQEISCYGADGVGDTGDHWVVTCSSQFWLRDSPVNLKHQDTSVYLGLSGRTFGRPINGQMEVVGLDRAAGSSGWKTSEGLYLVPKANKDSIVHTEL